MTNRYTALETAPDEVTPQRNRPHVQQSIDIVCRRGPQQQTRRLRRKMEQTDRRGTVSQTVLARLRGQCGQDYVSSCGISLMPVVYQVQHSNSRFESIRFVMRIYSNLFVFFRFVKKRPFDSLVVMQFFLLIYCIVSAKKIS